jgi:hypothetical protein
VSAEFIVTLLVLLGLTIPVAIGGVFLGRNTYYKSLPARVKELEDEVLRTRAANERLGTELDMWRSVATQTPEIKELVALFGQHHKDASERFREQSRQHTEILGNLIDIKAYMTRNKT